MQRPLLKEIDPIATGHICRMALMNQDRTCVGVSSAMYECYFTCVQDNRQALSFVPSGGLVVGRTCQVATEPPAIPLAPLYPIWYTVSVAEDPPQARAGELSPLPCLRVLI